MALSNSGRSSVTETIGLDLIGSTSVFLDSGDPMIPLPFVSTSPFGMGGGGGGGGDPPIGGGADGGGGGGGGAIKAVGGKKFIFIMKLDIFSPTNSKLHMTEE
jgi:hypothetical protein